MPWLHSVAHRANIATHDGVNECKKFVTAESSVELDRDITCTRLLEAR